MDYIYREGEQRIQRDAVLDELRADMAKRRLINTSGKQLAFAEGQASLHRGKRVPVVGRITVEAPR